MQAKLILTALAAAIATPALAVDFTVTGPFAIPASGTQGQASVYPIVFTVAGLSGTIADVNFTLGGLNHGDPGDLDILLVGPGGENVMLMSDAGNPSSSATVNYVFDQQALALLSRDANPSGTYRPTNFFTGDIIPTVAGPYGDTLDVFNGLGANGIWRLFIVDDATSDVGSLQSATLSITTATNGAVPEPATWGLMLLGFGAVGYTLRRRKARIAFA